MSASDRPARQALHISSVQAWRGRFGGETGHDDAQELDGVVIEFGVDDGDIPPLLVPTSSVARLVAVLLEAAESEIRPLVPPRPAPSLGPIWSGLLEAERHLADDVPTLAIPKSPGVYAWFCDGRPIHLGRAKSKRGLRARIGTDHLVTETTVPVGSFRARVAEHLGLEVVPDPAGEPRLAPGELDRLNAWISCCEIAWVACGGPTEASELEAALRADHDPVFPEDG